MIDSLIGATEAAVLANVSRSTMHRWLRAAGIEPAMTTPGPNNPQLFRRTEVEALIREKRSA